MAKRPVTRSPAATLATHGTASAGYLKNMPANGRLALWLGLLSLLVYVNTLKNGFVLDDAGMITHNAYVTKGFSGIPTLLVTPHHLGNAVLRNDEYRPLSLVMFAAEYGIFGLSPAPYHFFNILLFAACVILLFQVLDTIFNGGQTAVAFIAAGLFALHPIHTEVVANIKSRDELLCFFFAFLSLKAFTAYHGSGSLSRLLAGAGCFFLSLLSKETSITFLAVLPLVFICYSRDNRKRSINILLSAVVMSAIFLVIRFAVLQHYHANESGYVSFLDNALAKQDLGVASRIATAILIMGYYARLLLVPWPLISDYSYNSIPFVEFTSPWVLATVVLYVSLFVIAAVRLVRYFRDPWAFGIFFLLITVSLFTNIPFLIGSTMAERFLFFPSAGYCLLAALILVRVFKLSGVGSMTDLFAHRYFRLSVIGLSVAFGALTIIRNAEWADNYTLCTNDVKKSPDNCRLNYYVGYELENTVIPAEADPGVQAGLTKDAIDHFSKAIAIYPDFADAHANLGFVYEKVGLADSAERHDKEAIRLKPFFPDAINNLGKLYYGSKKYQPAIELYKSAIRTKPSYPDFYTNIAACYGSMGKYDSSIYYLRQGIAVEPTYGLLYKNMSFTYQLMGMRDSAGKYQALAQQYTQNTDK